MFHLLGDIIHIYSVLDTTDAIWGGAERSRAEQRRALLTNDLWAFFFGFVLLVCWLWAWHTIHCAAFLLVSLRLVSFLFFGGREKVLDGMGWDIYTSRLVH